MRTAGGNRLVGDLVVVCAGAWLPALMPQRFGDLPTWRQALCYAEPPERYCRDWQTAPAIVTIGSGSGYTLPPLAGTGLKFGFGGHRRRGAPDDGFGWEIVEGCQVLAAFRPVLGDADAYVPLRMQVGYYVMNDTRRFVIEQTSRCLVVANNKQGVMLNKITKCESAYIDKDPFRA